jgi:hypothetical protein
LVAEYSPLVGTPLASGKARRVQVAAAVVSAGLLVMALTLLPASTRAQTPVATIATGVTPVSVTLPDGTTQAAVACTTLAGGWSSALAGSAWISPTSSGNCTTPLVGGTYVYTVTFTATGTPASETLVGSLMVDDGVTITLNGNPVAISLPGSPWRSVSAFSASGLVSGTNTLVFTVTNGPPGTITGASGLDFVATVTDRPIQPNCSVTGNLVGDCGFEGTSFPGSFVLVAANTGFPSATGGPWFSGPTGAELDKTAQYPPNNGAQSVDLNGTTTGSIFQDILTQSGHVYSVSFALAANPDFSGPCSLTAVPPGPTMMTLNVSFGSFTQSFQFDRTNSTQSNMQWTAEALGTGPLPASGAATRLEFDSTTLSRCGPTIDDVVVLDVPATPTPTATETPTVTPTTTATPTPTPSVTPTLAASALTTVTSASPSATETLTPMPSVTPTSTATPRPSPGLPVGIVAPSPSVVPVAMPTAMPQSASPAATPTATPMPDCGQTLLTEPGAPPGYVSDPRGPQGQPHPDYGAGPLVTGSERDAFRGNLPSGTHMAAVNDAIARGCSAQWIRSHLGSL